MVSIKDLATSAQFRGQPNHKIAEPTHVRTLPVIDNSIPTQSNITTSIDCYVSGQYVQRKNGKVLEVKQRYTIFISYSKGTQLQTMNEVRNRIVSDFESKYSTTFNVTNIFIPNIPIPIEEESPNIPRGQAGPLELYGGTDLFRSMTRFERARHEIKSQREMASTNIRSIKKRYGVRR